MKKSLSILLVITLVFASLCGCKEQEKADKDGIYVYYLNQLQTMLVKKSYKLHNKDTDKCVSELLEVLSTKIEDSDRSCPIPEDIDVKASSVYNGKLKLSFSIDYLGLSPVREALLRAAVVKTLVQIKGVESVAFLVMGEPLTDFDGNVIGVMNADSFVDDFGTEQGEVEEANLVLYYATSDAGALVREERVVHYNGNVPIEQVVIKYLSETPETKDAMPTLPKDVKILSISTKDGVCYVDLDETLLSEKVSLSENLILYSIVNSLCELDGIKKVQLFVGTGENARVLGQGGEGGYYEPDYRLVR
ncbi:MAG: GerMN domain-containing protein [Lachnospiraceae bacterium]|nr:GerMN domain-containing protein [Lachnospiraceae bacterium]